MPRGPVRGTDSGNWLRKLNQETHSGDFLQILASRFGGPAPGTRIRTQETGSRNIIRKLIPGTLSGTGLPGRRKETRSRGGVKELRRTTKEQVLETHTGNLIRNLDCADGRLAPVNSRRRSSSSTAVHNQGLGPDTANRDPYFAKHCMHPADQGTCYDAPMP